MNSQAKRPNKALCPLKPRSPLVPGAVTKCWLEYTAPPPWGRLNRPLPVLPCLARLCLSFGVWALKISGAGKLGLQRGQMRKVLARAEAPFYTPPSRCETCAVQPSCLVRVLKDLSRASFCCRGCSSEPPPLAIPHPLPRGSDGARISCGPPPPFLFLHEGRAGGRGEGHLRGLSSGSRASCTMWAFGGGAFWGPV